MVRTMRTLVTLLPLALLCPAVPALAGPVDAKTSTAGDVGPEVPADIPASVYRARRERLARSLGSCTGVLTSQTRGDKLDEHFFYLTGVKESGAVLVIAPREPIYRHVLTLRSRDPEAERWEGYREPMSYDLRKKYGFDYVGRNRGPRALARYIGRSRCYAKLRSAFDKPDIEPKVLGKILSSYSARTEQKWQDLIRLRSVHDAAEILRMDKAVAITIEGHRTAARELVAGARERAVASRIEDTFYAHGATGLAFDSIVAAGPNGAVLHWTKRDRVIQSGDLIVVDIGSSYGGYASDITRTYPASGVFTPEQKKIYETVLAVQNKIIAEVRPGISLDRLNYIAEQELVKAGFEAAHSVGHFVGLNVHDVGDRGAPLEPGMVITVEPGIYLKGTFGVRIEDQVLVTPRGSRLMTGALPRTVSAIEAFIREARKK